MGRITNEEVLATLKKIKKDLSKKYKIQKMFLFGSRAREDHKLSSDVDLMIISKDFQNTPFRQRPNDFLDAWTLPIDFEVLCYTPEEFSRKKKEYGIVKQAAKEGKAI